MSGITTFLRPIAQSPHDFPSYKAPGREELELKQIGVWGYATANVRHFHLVVFTDDAEHNCPEAEVPNSRSEELTWPTSLENLGDSYSVRPTMQGGQAYWIGLITELPAWIDRAETGGTCVITTGTYPDFTTGDAWHTATKTARNTSMYFVYDTGEQPPPEPPSPETHNVTLAWDPNTETDLAGYKVYVGMASDQQGNLSAGLGIDLNQLNSTAHRLLINEVPEIARYLIEIRPQLKLLPNSIDIEADDLLEAKKVNREVLLRRQLKPILPDFDVVIIDTPPAMRAATINALVVADSVIIPIDSSSFALLGMNQLLKTIAAISETHSPALKILVLSAMFNR